MAEMTHEYSRFPNNVYTLHNFRDVRDAPDSVMSIINNIKSLEISGQYNAAAQLIEQNSQTLAQYLIDAETINAIDEEIRNLEIYSIHQSQTLFYQNNEPDCVAGDIWLG
jgi:hypothetical protein